MMTMKKRYGGKGCSGAFYLCDFLKNVRETIEEAIGGGQARC